VIICGRPEQAIYLATGKQKILRKHMILQIQIQWIFSSAFVPKFKTLL